MLPKRSHCLKTRDDTSRDDRVRYWFRSGPLKDRSHFASSTHASHRHRRSALHAQKDRARHRSLCGGTPSPSTHAPPHRQNRAGGDSVRRRRPAGCRRSQRRVSTRMPFAPTAATNGVHVPSRRRRKRQTNGRPTKSVMALSQVVPDACLFCHHDFPMTLIVLPNQ